MTSYVGKPFATGQPTRPTQPFIFLRSINGVVSSNQMSATSLGVVLSGECLRGEGLVWLIGAVVCLLAAAAGPVSVSAGSGWLHSAAAPLALANQLPLPRL